MLRRPLGIALSDRDTATDDKELHIAAFENGEVVGCVLLRPLGAGVVKLRQAAVYDRCQGQGVGARLVKHAEDMARARGFEVMEMHARTFARGFYEKLGYSAVGEEFIEATVLNIKMYKSLQPSRISGSHHG